MSELLYDIDEPAQARIVAWRERVFERLGFDVVPGRALAMRRDVDHHAAGDMLTAGATHAQVVGILL